jgi:HEAT repeat protein
VQAASALGRIGADEDRALLIKMTGDSNWWVRYRAAQALANMPSVGISELKALAQNATDRFAANILAQVIAEREAA